MLKGVQFSDCEFGDKSYSHGESWHPSLTPFGEMKCYLCRCKVNYFPFYLMYIKQINDATQFSASQYIEKSGILNLKTEQK